MWSRRTRAALSIALAFGCTRDASAPPPADARPAPPPSLESRDARGGAPAPGATAGARRFEQRLFTLELPAGWERVRHDDSGRRDVLGAENQVRFEDGRGRWLVVVFDTAGAGFAADVVWQLAANASGDGVRVAAEEPPCRRPRYVSSEEAMNAEATDCPAGDGRLDAVAVAPPLAGHGFVFLFGDLTREKGVDLAPFRHALATFRVR